MKKLLEYFQDGTCLTEAMWRVSGLRSSMETFGAVSSRYMNIICAAKAYQTASFHFHRLNVSLYLIFASRCRREAFLIFVKAFVANPGTVDNYSGDGYLSRKIMCSGLAKKFILVSRPVTSTLAPLPCASNHA